MSPFFAKRFYLTLARGGALRTAVCKVGPATGANGGRRGVDGSTSVPPNFWKFRRNDPPGTSGGRRTDGVQQRTRGSSHFCRKISTTMRLPRAAILNNPPSYPFHGQPASRQGSGGKGRWHYLVNVPLFCQTLLSNIS